MLLGGLGTLTAGLAVGLGWRVHAVGRRRPTFPERPLTTVVLGARVFADGRPSAALVDRVAVASGLWNAGRARRLLLSGGAPDDRPTEASVMAQLARDAGVPDDALVLEAASRSTFENARECDAWLRAHGETEILLVTCDFHLARAGAHFRTRGLTVWPVPSLRALTTADRLMVTAKETVSLARRPWLITRL